MRRRVLVRWLQVWQVLREVRQVLRQVLGRLLRQREMLREVRQVLGRLLRQREVLQVLLPDQVIRHRDLSLLGVPAVRRVVLQPV
jgi:hypothetical protein